MTGRKKSFAAQSGQATTELAIMLLGFVVLLLGLIFTLSLEIFNTRVLMDSKYRTEKAAHFDNAGLHGGAGKGIKGWEYNDGIPFTLSDQPITGSGDELMESDLRLGSAADSREGGSYQYEWKNLRDFPKGAFAADYKGREQSAIAAANLVTQDGDAEGRILTAKLPELTESLAKVLGIKIDYDRVRNNPSNRVYMPANGEL